MQSIEAKGSEKRSSRRRRSTRSDAEDATLTGVKELNHQPMLAVVAAQLANEYVPGGLATFINPYSYLKLRVRRDLLVAMDRVYVDGALLARLLRWIGIPAKRLSLDMTSLAPVVLDEVARSQGRVVFIGGEPGTAQRALSRLSRQFELSGGKAYSGFFGEGHHRRDVINAIVQYDPDVVLAGLGVCLQEQFLIDLREAGWQGAGFTCGAFLSQTAAGHKTSYYPKFINSLGLRWLYRIYDEPRLFRRYTVDYLAFMIQFTLRDAPRLHRYQRREKTAQTTKASPADPV